MRDCPLLWVAAWAQDGHKAGVSQSPTVLLPAPPQPLLAVFAIICSCSNNLGANSAERGRGIKLQGKPNPDLKDLTGISLSWERV